MNGVSEAYVAVVEAVGMIVTERPMRGLQVAKVREWTIALNATREQVEHEGEILDKWQAKVTHERFLVIAVLGPLGGIVGGMPESKFIAEMKALAPPINGEAAT